MNPRERFLETLCFGQPDRIPFMPGSGRKSTLERWYTEGLPSNVTDISLFAYHEAGGKEHPDAGDEPFEINERMIPQFEEKIIEQKENSRIVQDWKGNICEIGNEFTVEHLRNAIDFVTRRWIKCPVENRLDWEKMKKRYDAGDPSRYPQDTPENREEWKRRTHPLGIHVSGPFWQLREWVGFENLCMMFIEDPILVKDMVLFWEDYIVRLLLKVFSLTTLDYFYISEDMAYKSFSMISPSMCREFLLPTWKRWGEIVHQNNVPLYICDSDGFIGELIPIWIEGGINVCDPIEVAAGNDIVEFREKFGNNIAYIWEVLINER
jgi:uroporphyrinogen decarboxylase